MAEFCLPLPKWVCPLIIEKLGGIPPGFFWPEIVLLASPGSSLNVGGCWSTVCVPMDFHLSKEELKGFEVDLNSFIDEFVLKVADGAPLTFTTFRKMWKARNMSFVVVTPQDVKNIPRYIQSVFMIIMDRMDHPSPLKHTVKKKGRPVLKNANAGNHASGCTEEEIIANLVHGDAFGNFEAGEREPEASVDMDTLMQDTAQVLGLGALENSAGGMSVDTNQRSEEARDIDRWGNMINDVLVSNPAPVEPGDSVGRVQSASGGGAKASDFSRDISRDPRRRTDRPCNKRKNRAGDASPFHECQPEDSSIGGDLGRMRSESAMASSGAGEGPEPSGEKSDSRGWMRDDQCRPMSDRKSPAVSGDARPSGKVSNSSAGIESLLARGGTPDIFANLDQDFDAHLKEMESTLADAYPMVKMQPLDDSEVGPIDEGNWTGGMSDAAGDNYPSVKEDEGVPNTVDQPCPSLSSGSLNLSEVARQVMGGGQEEFPHRQPHPPTSDFPTTGGEHGDGCTEMAMDDGFRMPNPEFDRNLDDWVPFEAKVAAVFALYVCFKVQVLQPKSMIHMPYTILACIVEMLPELHSRGMWDCLKILKSLLMENAFVFGIYRRPPPGKGVPTSYDQTEIDMGCELILHMKTTLKGACNPNGVQLHCKRYDEARSLLSKLGNWTAGLIGREGTTEGLFDCSLGTRLDKIISEQQHLMQECVASKEIRHGKRGCTEIKDLHRKSLDRLHDMGPWQKDLGIHLAPSKKWMILEQRARETAAEKRKRIEDKQKEKDDRRKSQQTERTRRARWKLTESEAEELEMLKRLPGNARKVSMRDFERRHMARLGLPYTPPSPFKRKPAAPKQQQQQQRPSTDPGKSIMVKRKKIVPFPVQKAAAVLGDSKHQLASVTRTRPLDVSIEECDLSGVDGLGKVKKRSRRGKRGVVKAADNNLNSVSDEEGKGGEASGEEGGGPAGGSCQAGQGEPALEEGEKLERDLDKTLQDIDRMLDEEMALG
ncbi:hypothetical protein BSKO_10729 [Bryopsis sp. KO-2023]|nr:hypothetical protein BSKO_10729 [Bryopsis sp. KO-2023]